MIMQNSIIKSLEIVFGNKVGSILVISVFTFIWYTRYINLTSLEKLLLTRTEKLLKKILNALIILAIFLFLIVQKAYRLTKAENPKYNFELLISDLYTMKYSGLAMIVAVFIVVICLEVFQKNINSTIITLKMKKGFTII